MKKLLTIFITLFLINYSLSATTENCKVADEDPCKACKDNYLLTADASKCILGCKAEDKTTKNTCGECNDGYTLASGACTEKAASGDSSGSDSKDSKTDSGDEDDNSFGLHYSLLLGLFAFLF